MTPSMTPASPSPRASTFVARFASLFLLAVVPLGCSSTPTDPTALPPGINDTFLDEEMKVEKYVEMFEGESRAIYANRFEIVEALELTPGDTVADIGAGTGFFSFLMSEAVGRTGRVAAVEISPRFLDHLREQKADRGLENLSVVEGTERSVELPTASTDLAFICDVYHHFTYPQSSLWSIHQALRPDGRLVVVDFERIPGVSREWLMDHVRAGKEVFRAEIEAAGFTFEKEIEIEGLEENYFLVFRK